MSVSVVLPVFINKQENIEDTVRCINLLREKTKHPFELIIVETGSEYFLDEADIYICEKKKTNPNTSVNRGFKACNSDYVVFIGNDVFVDDEWLESLVKCFDIKDCGIATLGNNEHNDYKQKKIVEEIYFSICMVKKEDAWLDSHYTYIFDDTDMIMRIYLSGRKCYKNLNSIVIHTPHSTYGKFCGNKEEYEKNRKYFKNKFNKHSDHPIYKRLA